jgi:hypothetical protein
MSPAPADIQIRCRAVAEHLEALAGSPNDLIASADPNQKMFLEAASLVRGYHQCLLVQTVLTREQMAKALIAYAQWCGGVHDDGCPEDDTCSCSGQWINDGVTAAVHYLEGR